MILEEHAGIRFREQTLGVMWKNATDGIPATVGIYWATELTDATSMMRPFLAYGNEAVVEYYYAHICLVAQVGPLGERRIPKAK